MTGYTIRKEIRDEEMPEGDAFAVVGRLGGAGVWG
jgi:hypothetical protein